ncbi:MAG: hypothetical protein BWZ10_00511 [candidate division BRC1 bacterium ADurb.BinA364]|nr:MAG: hypothetical protein BWZ10_00511 [candidate division BRC1 bacterium ADurb.BinA364]
MADRGAAIQGQTRQSSGAGEASALPGASVTALNLTAALANADYTPRQASADEQGRFSITDLPGGVYEIIAAGPDGPIEDPSQSCRVLPAGAAIRADFESKTAAARGRLIVNVAGEDGAALQGANLTLILDAPGGTRRQAQCGAAGQAAFDNLAEGEYQLAVSHPSDGARSKMLGIHFQGGADQTLSIRFHERKQVTGRVLRAGQPAGAGVVRFTMKRDADYDLRGGLIAAPISPATGEFEAWLEPGLYEIGIAGAEPRPLQIDAGPGPVQPLLIEAP